ncbi:MAG: D-alanyl-D-alanine carboxypeptidase/D-alanyl-D-alanine-endopeptidase [Bacteroidetes bacterium]|nr:D-alanyl-D-alanine carboxypeptidase/D-alanyl-D-alanine-endopeptidase [Bacteroidota bacterium]
MKKILLCISVCVALFTDGIAQNIAQRLEKAWAQYASDTQLKHAMSSLYVIDAVTGKVVFDKNSQVGMAPASTQKIVTAVTAFELLGKDFKYKTNFGITENKGLFNLYITPSGDPTLGSWRWNNTKMENILNALNGFLKTSQKVLDKTILVNKNNWSTQYIPDGWIWQDIGNYYGAGAGYFNWRENQYDVALKSGKKTGDKVEVVSTTPTLYATEFNAELTSAAVGTGDNAYIYLPESNLSALTIRGTIPVNESKFVISGTMPNPLFQFTEALRNTNTGIFNSTGDLATLILDDTASRKFIATYTHSSPTLDSIVYWFLKKSINLYGEALIKKLAFESKRTAATATGVDVLKKFWKNKGLDIEELNLYDGSGLSPLNRITTHAQVEILKYAKTKDWFKYFYDALPEFNGMKMKSGTISDVKGYCGYHQSKDGKEYIFSFLVNNYSGKTSSVINKMFKVLDELK